jgi:hypothetical protein
LRGRCLLTKCAGGDESYLLARSTCVTGKNFRGAGRGECGNMFKTSCGPQVFQKRITRPPTRRSLLLWSLCYLNPGCQSSSRVLVSLHRERNKCIFRLTCTCIELCTSSHHLHRSRQESDAAAGLSEYPIQPMELQGSAYSEADRVRHRDLGFFRRPYDAQI